MNEFSTFFVLAMIGFKRIFAFILLAVVGFVYVHYGVKLIDLIPLSDEYYRGLLYALILPSIPLILCIIWIIKILRDPTLTKEEKINRLFGRY
ncbi:hypothetical protein [Gallibacterium genomosp. 1]|uniref:Uncharacterized protein n=1 Tax=Gallibacterium genomosp. 1 TaxID=155515 RepID=A0AB36DTS0_9PAST|nr:hypothetical protein [Gallibacterium genomosp. 1]OBW98132.1 hypothetical protein QV04_09650 [Gallibacterium genomosp. 1]OBW98693.1 hypothetical protein QV05_10605 [Gallibacterium genomosp. 1]